MCWLELFWIKPNSDILNVVPNETYLGNECAGPDGDDRFCFQSSICMLDRCAWQDEWTKSIKKTSLVHEFVVNRQGKMKKPTFCSDQKLGCNHHILLQYFDSQAHPGLILGRFLGELVSASQTLTVIIYIAKTTPLVSLVFIYASLWNTYQNQDNRTLTNPLRRKIRITFTENSTKDGCSCDRACSSSVVSMT